jgi:hypothetical protein
LKNQSAKRAKSHNKNGDENPWGLFDPINLPSEGGSEDDDKIVQKSDRIKALPITTNGDEDSDEVEEKIKIYATQS